MLSSFWWEYNEKECFENAGREIVKTVLKRVIMISGKVNKSNESIVDFGIKRLYGFVVDLAWVLTVSFVIC